MTSTLSMATLPAPTSPGLWMVEFELRLLNSAGRGGETGPLLLTGLDRERLKRIRTYADWLLTESQRPPHPLAGPVQDAEGDGLRGDPRNST